ncbi:hypothetical protein M0Q50_00180 [bacterium]|jgi:hypothetical protein|nr:hypothetical protein [bacterium]
MEDLICPRTFAKEAAMQLLFVAQRVSKKRTKGDYPSSEKLNEAYKKIASCPEEEIKRLKVDILPEKFLLACLDLIVEAAKEGKSIILKKDFKVSPQVKRIILRISADDRFIEKVKNDIQKGQSYKVSDELMGIIDILQFVGIIEA